MSIGNQKNFENKIIDLLRGSSNIFFGNCIYHSDYGESGISNRKIAVKSKSPWNGGSVMNKTSCLTRRVMSLLMALLLVVGMAERPVFPAVTAEASSLFDDYVESDGKIKDSAGADGAGGFETVITQYKTIAVAITGILTITMLIFMLIQFTKLGAAGDNEMARKKAIMGILTTGIATALLGGATIVVGFFWNVLTNTSDGGGGAPGGDTP